MNGEQPLRVGNRALDYLLSRFQPHGASTKAAIDALPRIATVLFGDAQDDARRLLSNAPELVSDRRVSVMRAVKSIGGWLSGATHRKEQALAESIFDLQLTSVFTELCTYVDNKEIASLLVDALVFQATGKEAGCPRQDELLLSTQNVRGIGKFTLAHQKTPHIGDIEAWTFGKEFGAIVFDSPMDIINIIAVSSFSLIYRVRAQWSVKFLLYGTRPTEADKSALDEMLKKQAEGLQKMTQDAIGEE
jgi:hypothetical protein